MANESIITANSVSVRDKFAMVLTQYGYSLEEGAKLYDRTMQEEELTIILKHQDIVLWLVKDGVRSDFVSIVCYNNYWTNFCTNNNWIADLVLCNLDCGLDTISDEQRAKFLQFHKACKSVGRDNCPDLDDELKWIFGDAGITDYMDSTCWELSDDTQLKMYIQG